MPLILIEENDNYLNKRGLPSFRITVHVRPEWVFTLPQNMQALLAKGKTYEQDYTPPAKTAVA